MLLDAHIITPGSMCRCGKFGAWSLIHKVPFTLEEHVKTINTDDTRFFFQKKNLVIGKQMFTNVRIQSTTYSKKELFNLYVHNKLEEPIGDSFCPTCENGKFCYNSTKNICNFYDCKKYKASCHVTNSPFKKQKTNTDQIWWKWYMLLCKNKRVATTKSCLFC